MNNRNRISSLKLSPLVSLAGTLLLASPVIAHQGDPHNLNMMREMRALNPDRSGRELRQMVRNQVSLPQANNAASQVHGFTNHRLERFNLQSHYMNDAGRTQAIKTGLALDLTSDQQTIVLGNRLFANSSSYTIKEGGVERVLTSGSKVSAAEYVALQQVISGGEQKLVVDGSGRGVSGAFSLNTISDGGTTIRASALVIPEQVVASGDFARNADGLRVTNDLTNFGSINAYSSNERKNIAKISARDINNEAGGSINSTIDLSLHADRDINNSGSITSSGDLSLSASHVNNKGLISSSIGNINLAGNGDADLFVTNSGGVINASNGAINIRSADYNGIGNSTISGGDLNSRELNLFTGQGSADVFVDQLTGVVNSSGSAAHVSSKTDTLTIGSQCLLGDPTYYNTGNIILGGNITVGEKLAIIAGGDITSTAANLVISTQDGTNQGHNIVMIAGANITAGAGQITPAGGPATLPAQGAVPTENATNSVTVDPSSSNSGNIDLSGVTGSLTINAGSTGTNQSGADVTLAAFTSAGTGGQIKLPSFAVINTAGNGLGSNGNVGVFAGGSVIALGDVVARGGSGTVVGTGGVNIFNVQPGTTDGLPITFDVNGNITSGNTIVGSPFVGLSGTIAVGDIDSSGSVFVNGQGTVSIGDIDASGANAGQKGGSVVISSSTSNVLVGTIDANGGDNSNGGVINITSNGTSVATSVTAASAGGGINSGAGGTIDIANTGSAGILLGNGVFFAGSSTTGGSITLNTPGVLTANGATLDAGGGFLNQDGSVFVIADSITCITGGLQILADNGFNGAINITTSVGGINTNGNDFRARTSGGTINLNIATNAISVGGSGDAGTLELVADSINFTSSAQNPLQLFANGSGTGSGGTIKYTNPTAAPTFVGTPAKAPKTAANFLTTSAHSGAADGDGGSISLIVGGSLTAAQNSIDVTTSPSGSIHNGGTIFISTGLANGGALSIAGDLFASGSNGGLGGSIALSSVYKKSFVIGGTKTAKNGVGNLFATGAPGSGDVSINSQISGVQLASSNGIQATRSVNLSANGKGKISASKGAQLSFVDTVSLSSQSGDIALAVSAANLSLVSTFGSVSVTNNTNIASVLSNSSAGGSFTLSAVGPLSVNNVTAGKGSINLVTGALNGGTLNVAGNITATDGTITIQNNDTVNGDITVQTGVFIQTAGAKGGNVAIVIGPVPKKPVNPIFAGSEPPNFSVFNNGGQCYVGQNPAGCTATFSTTLVGENADVILNNASIGGKTIAFFGTNKVQADPPSRLHTNTIPVPAAFTTATTGSYVKVPPVQNAQLVSYPLAPGAILPTDSVKRNVAPVVVESIYDNF